MSLRLTDDKWNLLGQPQRAPCFRCNMNFFDSRGRNTLWVIFIEISGITNLYLIESKSVTGISRKTKGSLCLNGYLKHPVIPPPYTYIVGGIFVFFFVTLPHVRCAPDNLQQTKKQSYDSKQNQTFRETLQDRSPCSWCSCQSNHPPSI